MTIALLSDLLFGSQNVAKHDRCSVVALHGPRRKRKVRQSVLGSGRKVMGWIFESKDMRSSLAGPIQKSAESTVESLRSTVLAA